MTPPPLATADRVALLRRSPLGELPEEALDVLAGAGRPVSFEAGEVVVREGESGDDLYLVASGRLEVSTDDWGTPTPVATVRSGDVFGELALLTDEPVRRATVTAIEPSDCLSIGRQSLDQALAGAPAAARHLRRAADLLAIARLLRSVGPLAGLDDAASRRLAGRIEERVVEAGRAIVTAGDPSTECFVLRSGRAEVLGDGEVAPIAELRPGSLFGEIGLLAGEPRTATVRAVEDCRVLVLDREAVVDAARSDPRFVHAAVELMRLRERPRRAGGVEIHDDPDPGRTDSVAILKNPDLGRYFRLSPLGRFVWERLDGTRNIRDLALEYYESAGRFAPEQIAQLVTSLAAAGFVAAHRVGAWLDDAGAVDTGTGRWERAVRRARATLTWHRDLSGVDGWLARLYRAGGRILYTPVGRTLAAGVAAAGLGAFLWPLISGSQRLGGEAPLLLWLLIPGFFVSILVHELGHALTTKAIGREVRRAGIGWFWLGPMAYVDVSDTWLATRRQRLLVAGAGPYASVVLAGAAALVAPVAGPMVGEALWWFALSSYLFVLQNMNPLIELDGYYLLVHWLGRPNLRSRSLAWLRDEGPACLRRPGKIRGHVLEAGYAVASVVYLVGMAVFAVAVYRVVLEEWIGRWLPSPVSAGLGWTIGLGVVLFTVAAVAGDVRAAGRLDPARV